MTSPAEAQSKLATSSDPAIANPAEDASGRQPTASSPAAAELASTKISLHNALRRFPDFPIPGINFIDIMPWFLDPSIHATLLRSLELQLLHFGESNAAVKPDVVVGLDARGFLFGPSLALKLDASFVPVRKKGKLPGPCVTAAYEKEYGADYFQMQEGSIKPGQKVLVVDDIIATGKFEDLSCYLEVCHDSGRGSSLIIFSKLSGTRTPYLDWIAHHLLFIQCEHDGPY